MKLEITKSVEELIPVESGSVILAGEFIGTEYVVVGHVDGATVVKTKNKTYCEMTGLGLQPGYKKNSDGYICTVGQKKVTTETEVNVGDVFWADIEVDKSDAPTPTQCTVIHVMNSYIIVGTGDLTVIDNIYIIGPGPNGYINEIAGSRLYKIYNFREEA